MRTKIHNKSDCMTREDFHSLQDFAKANGMMRMTLDKVIPKWKQWKEQLKPPQ